MFGGFNGTHAFNDLWKIKPSTSPDTGDEWTQSFSCDHCLRPEPRYATAAAVIKPGVWNVFGGGIYVFGGKSRSGDYFNDLWAVGGSDWVQLCGDGTNECGKSPPARAHHMMTAIGDTLYVYGGDTSGGLVNDLWAIKPSSGNDGAAKPRWKQLCDSCGPSARIGAAIATTTGGTDFFVFGGLSQRKFHNDLWHYGKADRGKAREKVEGMWRKPGRGAENVSSVENERKGGERSLEGHFQATKPNTFSLRRSRALCGNVQIL